MTNHADGVMNPNMILWLHHWIQMRQYESKGLFQIVIITSNVSPRQEPIREERATQPALK